MLEFVMAFVPLFVAMDAIGILPIYMGLVESDFKIVLTDLAAHDCEHPSVSKMEL